MTPLRIALVCTVGAVSLLGGVFSTPSALAAAPHDTFNLFFHTYCAPGTFCDLRWKCASPPAGFDTCPVASYEELRGLIRESVQEMNLLWQPLGISFRPIVFQVDSSDPNFYQTTGCADDAAGNPRVCANNTTACTQDSQCAGIGDGVCRLKKFCPDLVTSCTANAQCGGDPCLSLNEQRRNRWQALVAAPAAGALHLMIVRGPGRCCSRIPNHRAPQPICIDNGEAPDDSVNTAGLWCDAGRLPSGNGSIWAHEMGHHWCLWHTFTGDDPADVNPPEHNPDSLCDVLDTNDDPAPFEAYQPGDNTRDQDSTLAFVSGHEWCGGTKQAADPKSPRPTWCQPACSKFDSNGLTPWNMPDRAPLENAMSYHSDDCRGPYVVNGLRTEAFTLNQRYAVEQCRLNVATRQAGSLPNICATYGGDGDGDGVCNGGVAADNCPKVANTAQYDKDGDGVGNACDNCPDTPGPTGDIDQDLVGDICDKNLDGDACGNGIDQHPTQAKVAVGTHYYPGCGSGIEVTWGSESGNADGDAWLNCQDHDDDNDGVCDEGGPLSQSQAPGLLPGGCVAGPGGSDPCPLEAGEGCLNQPLPFPCKPTWIVCEGPGCFPYKLKLIKMGDPDPQATIEYLDFTISNRTLFIGSLPARTISETARSLQIDAAGAAAAPEAGGPFRLEIWSKAPDAFVALVAEYDPESVDATSITHGAWVAVRPQDGPGGTYLLVHASWNSTDFDDPGPGDTDGDGFADPFDNCSSRPNPPQLDADGDGFGNACDADLDNDFDVDSTDVAAIADCDGADLSAEIPILEPRSIGGWEDEPFDPNAPLRAARCAPADLDESGLVDGADLAAGIAALGNMPGPSAFQDPVDRCAGVSCDDGVACTVDRCVRATGECVHAPRDCADDDACSVDYCDEGIGSCIHAGGGCDDGNPCTDDACDAANAACLHTPVRDGGACDDGSSCTSGGTCSGGACVPASTVTCDDGDLCSDDACDPLTGACLSTPRICDDGDLCTADACAAGFGCVSAAIAVGDSAPLDFTDPVTLAWDGDSWAGHWNTYRGTIPRAGMGSRRSAYDDVCLDGADSAADGPARTLDRTSPDSGEAFYYVTTQESPCGEGPAGVASSGEERPRPFPCTTPP
jgi:hypothetical protein